jgi:hypothetical protein
VVPMDFSPSQSFCASAVLAVLRVQPRMTALAAFLGLMLCVSLMAWQACELPKRCRSYSLMALTAPRMSAREHRNQWRTLLLVSQLQL